MPQSAPSTENSALLIALGESVRAMRARRGLTRKTLAHSAGVSERHLANLESGQGNASLLILSQIAQALGCSIGALLGDVTASNPEWLLIRETLSNKSEAQLKQARVAVQALFGQTAAASKSHIALVGLRGAGKSTIGGLLAQSLGCTFIELSASIEQLAGCTVLEIHSLYGANAYRRYERRALEMALNDTPRAVIASPGGLVSDAGTFNILLKQCMTVWLQATPEEHMNRVLAQGDKRPMRGNREAMDDLRRILKEREPFYAQADLAFSTSGMQPEHSAQQLLEKLSIKLNIG